MRAMVLGCGPAGLIAAHAAMEQGCDVAIMSKLKRKSVMKGAQYLHRPIPGFPCGDPFTIEYILQGSPQGYRLKVYGRQWDGTVSPEDMTQSHSAWDIRRAYDLLWNQYGGEVQDWEATPSGLKSMMDKNNADIVISTVPANLLCHQGHTFRSARVWSTDSAYGVPSGVENTVICNGNESPRWYRSSRIHGWETTEWPDGTKPPITPMWEVLKPTDNNCDCFPEVLRSGRYGTWKKAVLSHETYDQVVDAIWKKKLEV